MQKTRERTYSKDEAAAYLGISITTINVYVSMKELPDHRDENNGAHMFYEHELAAYRAAHPHRGRRANLQVVSNDAQQVVVPEPEQSESPVSAEKAVIHEESCPLTMRVLLDYVARSHNDGQEVIDVTIRFVEYEHEGKLPYNRFVIHDPAMQAFFASLPVGQEFDMVLRKREK